MEMRSIGSIPVPLAGVGCNNFGRRIDEDRARKAVDAAFEAGATPLDTAALYGARPIAGTLTALSRLVDEGKVREVGCSNFSAEQLVEAEEAAKEKGVRR